MTKVTLDMNTFKALASDTRLDILRALDGKKMSLNDISRATKLNKATLHEHLAKLNEAGLVKRNEREGHKWVYYKLTWKGEGLLHPENTRIVVLFSTSFMAVFFAVVLITSFMQPITVGIAETVGDTTYLYGLEDETYNLCMAPSDERSPDTATYGRFVYLGSINATNLTVKDVSYAFQSNANIQNNIGQVYSYDEISWSAGDLETATKKLETDQEILTEYYYDYSDKGTETDNGSDNETDNNSLPLGDDGYAGFTIYSPAIPEMVATVQEPTFLYLAVACIIFFGLTFTYSSWRLVKNKKPKL